MSQTRILALVGSLRSASVNRQLAEAAAELAPEGADVVIYEGLAEIPFYNEDIDGDAAPAAAVALRDAGAEADAVLLFTVKAVGVAGGKIVEGGSLSVGGTIGKFGEAHPKEHAETAGQLAEVLVNLLAAEKALVDA